MLQQLLRLLEESQRSCQITELSRMLNAQPSAVEAMLESLVRRGRVVAVDAGSQMCTECALSGKCDVPVLKVRRYALQSRGAQEPQACMVAAETNS